MFFMIKIHTERNIKFSELLTIFSNFNKYNSFQLTKSLANMYPKRDIILTNYGRTALQLILDKYNIKNCKVMVPAFICLVFDQIFKVNKIKPVLIDVEMDTFNISERTLKKGFDSKAKCLIVNNMNGLPCPIKQIQKITKKKNIFLIEDCAHALGAKHKGKKIGLYGDAAFFSLYKNLPTIAGGFGLTKKLLNKLQKERITAKTIAKLIYHIGNNANKYKQFKKDEGLYDEIPHFEKIYFKGPNNITQKLASFYIKKLDKKIKARQKIAYTLIKKLKNKKLGLIFQKDPNKEHIFTYFSFLLPKELAKKRMKFLQLLRKKGVVGRIIWKMPLNSLYKNRCPNTKEISERIVGLPINPNYSKKQIEFLSETVVKCLEKL